LLVCQQLGTRGKTGVVRKRRPGVPDSEGGRARGKASQNPEKAWGKEGEKRQDVPNCVPPNGMSKKNRGGTGVRDEQQKLHTR